MMAARAFAFWDLSKSKHKHNAEMLKSITLHQSPININSEEAVYDPEFKVGLHYKPVHVSSDKPDSPLGKLVLDAELFGHITL